MQNFVPTQVSVRQSLITLMCVAIAASASAGILYEDVTSTQQGAIAYFRLNEPSGTVAADQVAGNNGTYASGVTLNQSNAPLPPPYKGFDPANVAVQFNNATALSYVDVPTSIGAFTPSSDLGSVSMWFNTTQAQIDTGGTSMLYYGNPTTGGDGFGSNNELHVNINSNGTVTFYIMGSPAVSTASSTSAGNFADGEWHHMAATWDSNDAGDNAARLYLDGTQVASSTHDANSFTFGARHRVGKAASNTGNSLADGRQFGGLADEVALYDRVLTPLEITDQIHAAVYHYDQSDFVYQPDAQGRLVGEAQLYATRQDDGSGNGWRVVPDESAGAGPHIPARYGSYIQSLPDNSIPGTPAGPPEIRYNIQIPAAGTYQLSVAWDGNSTNVGTIGGSDSMFADIVELKDGVGGTIADWYELTNSVTGQFKWDAGGGFEQNTAGASNDPIVWTFPSAGTYTLRFSQREDGSAVDAWVLQPVALGASGTAPTSP